MILDATLLAVVIGFMILANRLVESLVTPIFDKYDLDKFWLMYVAWAFSGIIVGFTQVNLFATHIPNEIVGLVLTAFVAGGGANLLHDLVSE